MEVVVCFKQAVNEGEIKVDKGSKKIILDGVPTKISEFDRNAVEEAVRLKEQYGGRVTAVTVAPPEASKVVKEVLAMGCDQAVHLSDAGYNDSDSYGTALIIASAIKKIGKFDLVLCAEGSSDIYSSQVGPSIAEALDLPQITYARKITVAEGRVRAERTAEEGVEQVESPLPCLVTVSSEINSPRLPTLVQIMAASRKPVLRWTPSELGLDSAPIGANSNVRLKKVEALTVERKGVFIQGDSSSEVVENLARTLLKEGVLK